MNPLVPAFLPLQTTEQSDDQTTGRRYRIARSKMPAATRQLIRVRHADGVSLRTLAAEYGVNHETIRTIVRAGGGGDNSQVDITPSVE